MRVWLVLTVVVPAVVVPAVLAAQSSDDEVRLARSAAPPAIANDAKVYVLDHGHYVVADPGRSTEACMVSRPEAKDVAPECGDAEADATELALERFRTEQRLAGRSKADVDRAIADGMRSGRFRAPKRPALVFMLSSAQELTAPDGKPVGHWYPHVMIFYPGMTASDLGVVDSPDVNIPGIAAPGSPRSAVIVVARSWVNPAPTP
jgi:hypothetical protein